MEFTVNQVAELLNGKVEGDGSLKVSRLDKIQEGKPGSISFLSNLKYEPYLYTTQASAVIVQEDLKPSKAIHTNLIRVKDPYSGFTQLLEAYALMIRADKSGVEQPSFMDESSIMGENGYRAAFSYIGKNSVIGNNVKIHAQAVIGDDVSIGDHCIIHPGARILNQSKIGNHCEIHSNAVIGSDGFGFAPQSDGTYKNIPQLGNVVLEDYVSIGAGTTIDRATLGSTVIKKGVKIDNLVQIAHNVVIGENTVIAAQAGISGSTEVGKNCILAGKAGLIGHLKIADRTTIGANTGISKSIIEEGTTVHGYMGFKIKDFLKSYAIFKKLPELQNKMIDLEKKL
ncbi:UDP-3-O-(3-hydroxymyristoyl)glucosamine N-acyltransferase [Anditalea andensis]|uniref:UDP-3-O-acylglucosamine N-acyltransferase n=1 Tax=Anditalea andensis TaxID=1048983 RepID=A0A074LLJ1_9BACT|nr:UDP-3-O-(3-hydroxymyristoyl)glucosamine N-acyltransferase [Anditalea andensis]KEO74717.1 UDP-3-O-(3-hydroxymyristoyl) glucosamine N-acyltransferase [Anditalea andensis]